MKPHKLVAGTQFPNVSVPKFGGGTVVLPKSNEHFDWHLVVMYRGKHCPLCTKYLSTLNELLTKLQALGVDVIAVSADPLEKVKTHIAELQLNYTVAYDLTVDQMRELGLYISNPRSSKETDRPFAEPGLFVINNESNIKIVDISNAPFSRPDLNSLVMSINFIRNPDNDYPIRGTY